MQISPCPIALPLGKLAALAGSSSRRCPLFRHRPTAIMGVREIHRMHVDRGLPASATTTSSGAMARLSAGDLKTRWARMSKDTIATAWESASSEALMRMARPRIISRKTSSLPSKPAAEPAWQISEGRYPRPSRLFRRHEQGRKIDSRDWLKECPCFDVKSWWSAQNAKTAIICLLLTGCATMQIPVCPEVTLKLCPAVTK